MGLKAEDPDFGLFGAEGQLVVDANADRPGQLYQPPGRGPLNLARVALRGPLPPWLSSEAGPAANLD